MKVQLFSSGVLPLEIGEVEIPAELTPLFKIGYTLRMVGEFDENVLRLELTPPGKWVINNAL